MIASLMMYNRPELAPAITHYWAQIRLQLAERGIASPESLAQSADEYQVWTHPQLVLSQTCAMPYRSDLHQRVQLIGTADYGLEDCPAGYYRSALVVRADDPREQLEHYENAVFAFNQRNSQSGYAAPYWHCAERGFWFRRQQQSHSHQASALAVAKAEADIAAIDAVTWRLIERYDQHAQHLRVLDWTRPTPGLPYICSASADAATTGEAVAAAISALHTDDRKTLSLRGLCAIPRADYLSYSNPPAP